MTKSNDGKRRFFTPAEKVGILKLNLLENVPVSEVCERHNLAPTLFYRWQKQFFENGAKAFENEATKQKPLERKIENLEAKLQTKNEVVSELMEEHLKLKKSLGET